MVGVGALAAAAAWTLGTQRVQVVHVVGRDAVAEPLFSTEAVAQLQKQLDEHFLAASGGLQRFELSVTEPPVRSEWFDAACQWTPAAETGTGVWNLTAALKIPPQTEGEGKFDRRLYVLPECPGLWDAGGWGAVQGEGLWLHVDASVAASQWAAPLAHQLYHTNGGWNEVLAGGQQLLFAPGPLGTRRQMSVAYKLAWTWVGAEQVRTLDKAGVEDVLLSETDAGKPYAADQLFGVEVDGLWAELRSSGLQLTRVGAVAAGVAGPSQVLHTGMRPLAPLMPSSGVVVNVVERLGGTRGPARVVVERLPRRERERVEAAAAAVPVARCGATVELPVGQSIVRVPLDRPHRVLLSTLGGVAASARMMPRFPGELFLPPEYAGDGSAASLIETGVIGGATVLGLATCDCEREPLCRDKVVAEVGDLRLDGVYAADGDGAYHGSGAVLAFDENMGSWIFAEHGEDPLNTTRILRLERGDSLSAARNFVQLSSGGRISRAKRPCSGPASLDLPSVNRPDVFALAVVGELAARAVIVDGQELSPAPREVFAAVTAGGALELQVSCTPLGCADGGECPGGVLRSLAGADAPEGTSLCVEETTERTLRGATCDSRRPGQQFRATVDGQLQHAASGLCLEALRGTLQLANCVAGPGQRFAASPRIEWRGQCAQVVALGRPLELGLCGPESVRMTAEVLEPPTASPTPRPSKNPTRAPTKAPTESPTKKPTRAPTVSPTPFPTWAPVASQQLVLGESGKLCVAVSRGKADKVRNGDELEVQLCDPEAPAQRFEVAVGVTLKLAGSEFCIDVQRGSQDSEVPLRLWRCSPQPYAWQSFEASFGRIKWVPGRGRCVRALNSRLWLTDCDMADSGQRIRLGEGVLAQEEDQDEPEDSNLAKDLPLNQRYNIITGAAIFASLGGALFAAAVVARRTRRDRRVLIEHVARYEERVL